MRLIFLAESHVFLSCVPLPTKSDPSCSTPEPPAIRMMGVDGRERQEVQEASSPPGSSPCPPCPDPCPPCPAPPYPAPSLPGRPGSRMQDGSDRSIKNGTPNDQELSQEDLLPKLEATPCRRSSLREGPPTPPPPPPPMSGAPVWERRPRVKPPTYLFSLPSTGTGAGNLCSSPLLLLHLQMSPSLTLLSFFPSQVSKYFLLQSRVKFFQIFPPSSETHDCFLGEIHPAVIPFHIHPPQGLQPQVDISAIENDQ